MAWQTQFSLSRIEEFSLSEQVRDGYFKGHVFVGLPADFCLLYSSAKPHLKTCTTNKINEGSVYSFAEEFLPPTPADLVVFGIRSQGDSFDFGCLQSSEGFFLPQCKCDYSLDQIQKD